MKVLDKKLVLISITLTFVFGSIGSAFGSDPNTYVSADNQTDWSMVLSPDSSVVINANTVDIHNNVYTFSNFDQQLSSDKVDDPSLYVLNSSGILLQASQCCSMDHSSYSTTLRELLDENSISANVTNLSAVSFEFSTDPGHNTVSLDFILASGEHYDGDWDIAGIYVDGVNYAYFPNGHLLRVNSVAQIADVCNQGSPSGCWNSDYALNNIILSSISKKLTLNAQLDDTQLSHTFTAIVANTDDFVLPSALLFGNLIAYSVSPEQVSTFSYGIQVDEPIVEVEKGPDLSDSVQQSSILNAVVGDPDANNNVTIKVSGKFIENVVNIEINGRRVPTDKWQQEETLLSVEAPSEANGTYTIQIWNRSVPVMDSLTVTVTA